MTKIEKLVKDYGIKEGCYLRVGNGVIVCVDKILKNTIEVHELFLGIKNCENGKATYYPIKDSVVEDGIQIHRVGPYPPIERKYRILDMRIVHMNDTFELRITTDEEKNGFYKYVNIEDVISADDIDRYTFDDFFRDGKTINNIVK